MDKNDEFSTHIQKSLAKSLNLNNLAREISSGLPLNLNQIAQKSLTAEFKSNSGAHRLISSLDQCISPLANELDSPDALILRDVDSSDSLLSKENNSSDSLITREVDSSDSLFMREVDSCDSLFSLPGGEVCHDFIYSKTKDVEV